MKPRHRILHIPTFWAEYYRYWDNPESATAGLRLKVLLVVGIGSSLYNHGDANAPRRNTDMVHQWIYAAQTWLTGPLEKDRLDITGLQIYCLTLLARQIFSIGGDTVWISMGSLIHKAMQIGLHRDPKHLPPMSVLQAEIRRRLWATVLDLAVQASLDSSMPPRISLDEFDTEPPSNINDDELDSSTTLLNPPLRTALTSTSSQLALLDSLPVRLRIVNLLNNLHSPPSYPAVLALTRELTPFLRNSPPTNNPFHHSLLDHLTRRFLLPLHASFAHRALADPEFTYSLNLSLDTALAILLPNGKNTATSGSYCPEFSHLLTSTPAAASAGGMFGETVRCVTTAVSLALLAHAGMQRTSGTLFAVRPTASDARGDGEMEEDDGGGTVRGLLKRKVRSLMESAEERVKNGAETNVKGAMFLGMVLAQVGAVEKGLDEMGVGREVARAAGERLGVCERLLRGRVEEVVATVGEEFGGDGRGVDVAGGGMEGVMGDGSWGSEMGDWGSLFFEDAGF